MFYTISFGLSPVTPVIPAMSLSELSTSQAASDKTVAAINKMAENSLSLFFIQLVWHIYCIIQDEKN